MVGPMLGSIFYFYFGYFGAFMVFAVILLVAGVLSFTLLPNSFNIKLGVQNEHERAMSIRAEAKVPYSWFFSNIRSFFGLLTCTLVCLIFSFHASFFTLALKRGKGIPD